VVRGYSGDITLQQVRRLGARLPDALELRPRVWFNTDLVSRNFLFPGLIAIIMMVIAALLTSLTIAREWENGTMEQLLTTPLRGPELIFGKLLPYLAIGILDLILALLVGEYVFDVPLRGSLPLLFALSLIFLVGALTFGMLISIIARSQVVAAQFALVATMLPAFLLSGFIFPIDNMPAPIRAVTHIVTARYFVTILRGIYLKDVGLEVLAGEVAFLTAFGVVVVALAIRKLQRKI
jgi:ABC-2 type transport system permease protein